nr:ATP phosphoribosyltransferase regulatory subunit [uncultured Aminipila sp.]
MNITESILNNEEKALLSLRGLYENYGYSQFKMAKFEEYDLYVRNKDFLLSNNIITFTDTNGKLMALKPDVTLSIIKNLKEESDCIQKVYYSENVYRVSKDTKTYKQLMQTGLECIGNLDLYNICEVILLASKSLANISSNYILALSHIGIISIILEGLSLTADQEKIIFKYIGEKNIHGIENLCKQTDSDEELCENLITLISMYGSMDTVLEKLKNISLNAKMSNFISELESICEILKLNGFGNTQIDFSIINGMNYYNEIVFQGFIDGIPSAVLSGGRYDKLMQKMGKHSGAIGFAVYVDLLEYLDCSQKSFDVDILLIYDADTDVKALTQSVKELNSTGQSVQVQKSVSRALKYKKLLQLKDGRLEILESND